MNYDFECADCGWTGNRYANLKVCPKCRMPVKRMMIEPAGDSQLQAENERLRQDREAMHAELRLVQDAYAAQSAHFTALRQENEALKAALQDKHLKHDIKMAYAEWISLDDVIEDIRILADSMSTHEAFAAKVGMSPQYLCDILKGKRKPGKAVLNFIKLEAVTMYREVRNV